jgi:tetratricopeptide (TPR) repeat protein
MSASQCVQLYDAADRLKAEGKPDEAIAKLEEALGIDENYALAHSALAVLLQRLGRHEDAIQHATRVTELEPNDPFSFTALSVTYQRAFAGTNQMGYIRLAEEAMERSRQLGQRH